MEPPLHFGIKSAVSWVDSSRPKQPKIAGKTLASVFWNAQGILFINFLEKGRIINSEYYIAWLVCLKEEITKKWPQMKKKCSFTMTMHLVTSQSQRWQKLHELHFKLLPHPPYSPDLGPQWLLAVCRPQKNVPGKEIWLQWRSDIENWGVVWGQRQINQQKRHQIVREVLEWVHHPRKKPCW